MGKIVLVFQGICQWVLLWRHLLQEETWQSILVTRSSAALWHPGEAILREEFRSAVTPEDISSYRECRQEILLWTWRPLLTLREGSKGVVLWQGILRLWALQDWAMGSNKWEFAAQTWRVDGNELHSLHLHSESRVLPGAPKLTSLGGLGSVGALIQTGTRTEQIAATHCSISDLSVFLESDQVSD